MNQRSPGWFDWIDGWNPYDPRRLRPRDIEPVSVNESPSRRVAALWFLGFFLIFLAWSVFAPIDAGVSVQGNVNVLGNRKAVQHPGGGVVQTIDVKEGMTVKEGDVLLRINPLRSDAELTSVQLQYINLLATESRLKAEQNDFGTIEWSPELTRRFIANDESVREAKSLQSRLFQSRKAEYQSQLAGLDEQIAGQRQVLESRMVQLRSLTQEMSNTLELAKGGYVPQMQANQAERQKIELDSSIASLQADMARARIQKTQLRSALLKDIQQQLQETQKNRDALLGKLDAAAFDRQLTEVRAQVAGSIVGLKVFSVGGVITPGQVLMEIVPAQEQLIVQAKIPALIIDKVQVGLPADLRFVSFNQSTTPVVEGVVQVIGADKEPVTSPAEGDYYLAQVAVTSKGMERLGELKIQPGMPVDVVIKSGERSFMSYLLKPLTDKMAIAFKQ
jgi:protease secretion system membrane fusion protein